MTYTRKRIDRTNAEVLTYDNGAIVLQSYSTSVCMLTPAGWLYCSGTYTPTTRQHISRFMRTYGNGADSFTAKRCATENMRYNIYTGEFEELPTGFLGNAPRYGYRFDGAKIMDCE